EELHYRADWRLVHAGNVHLSWSSNGTGGGWAVRLRIQSAGIVSRLYRVDDEYRALLDGRLCAVESTLRAQEGRKRREILVRFDAAGKKASYVERDLARDTALASKEIDIPGCVHDVIGGLYRLRAMRLEPGEAVYLPISDGKKSVSARVEAQVRETLRIEDRTYQTIRYEAFLFNNVLYRRSGRLLVWLTDDEARLPVRVRIRLPFYIGTVTLDLRPEHAPGRNSGQSSGGNS
ncbi:MAG: DUF3108 domain-containing protein, partial [Bryobacteraceae bacterium]